MQGKGKKTKKKKKIYEKNYITFPTRFRILKY
jgi:hypothetical protein